MAGGTPSQPVREWLPTTERSLLWEDGKGHMYKIIIDEYKANRFLINGTQYMDRQNECINTTTGNEGYIRSFDGLTVPKSCTVCSTAKPCLFDVRADPEETQNIANQNLALVKTMADKLATYNYYVPTLSPENLGCYK